MTAFEQYVTPHLTRKITVGQGGADVYELDNACIAKHIRKSALRDPSSWESYLREFKFYAAVSSHAFRFVPELLQLNCTEDEILLVMKQYRPLERSGLCADGMERIISTLAELHRLPLFEFLPQREPLRMEPTQISNALHGWQSVLCEHGQIFPEGDLQSIAERIVAVNQRAYSERTWCCHGDFHFDNLLSDENGNIVVCDWQGICRGHAAGDFSFFLSRLSADGVCPDKTQAVLSYCRAAGYSVTPEEITSQMALSNLNTSFLFWHQYLHGSSAERVGEIFFRMTADFTQLLSF